MGRVCSTSGFEHQRFAAHRSEPPRFEQRLNGFMALTFAPARTAVGVSKPALCLQVIPADILILYCSGTGTCFLEVCLCVRAGTLSNALAAYTVPGSTPEIHCHSCHS